VLPATPIAGSAAEKMPGPDPNAPAVAPEASAEQIHARLNIDGGATEKAAPSELAFALRMEPADQANATMAAPSSAASSAPMGLSPVAARPATADPQTASSANKLSDAESEATHPRQNQSQVDQSPNPGSTPNGNGEDTNRESRHSGSHDGTSDTVAAPAAPRDSGASEAARSPMPVAGNQPAASGLAAPPPAVPPSVAPPPAAPSASTAAALSRPATPAAVEGEGTVKTGTANQISISVPAGDQQKVEVRLMDRAGEVRVTVRTPDEDLASTLRSDIGSLTGKLNQSGYTTEAFAPSSRGGDFSREQKSADQNPPGGGQGQRSGRDPQQNSQQNSSGKRPAWLDEFENSLATPPARKDYR